MKWIGAVLIVLCCGGTGMLLSWNYRREERLLGQLHGSIAWMEWELQCRATELPNLFHRAAERLDGPLCTLFSAMGQELACRVAPDARSCMELALQQVRLPAKVLELVRLLGASVGEFHLDGQLQQLRALNGCCSRIWEEHTKNRDSRTRSFQTLGFCGGLALAILLL